MKENYFSWDNLIEMTDIQNHIEYTSSVLNKYSWDDFEKKSLKNQLDRIVDKQNDKTLNISVIGEFSTGKSSFINALVGQELLAVNVLQGTTVAITIIEYGETYRLSLVDKGGNTTAHNYKNISLLCSALQHYTTEPSYADTINYVRVEVPSDILKNGFRIIDTPGTNSLEQWHEDITRRAINDISDMSIILVDATRPLPETLIEFVENTIGNMVKDCLFVANKIDIISPRERSGMLKYIQKKIGMSFDIQEVTVLPFASIALTNLFAKDVLQVDEDSRQLTLDSLRTILAFTSQKRIKAQARKLLYLVDNMYTGLKSSINSVVQKYQAELGRLELSKQTDFKPFITKQIAIRQKLFLSSAQEEKLSVGMQTDKLVKKAISNINSKIDSHTSTTLDGLSQYIQDGELTSDIKAEGVQIASQIEKNLAKIRTLFKKQLSEFQNDFEQEFTKLKVLTVKLEVTPREVNVTQGRNTANIGPVASLIRDELSRENWAVGGGIAAGATIGACLGGPLGALIGGAIGLFAGSGVAPDTNEVKNNVKAKLNIPLKTYYNSICYDCMSNYSTYITEVNKSIEVEINRYYSKYNSEISRRFDKWKEDYAKIQFNIQRTKIEISEISNRKLQIQNILTRIGI